MYYLFKNNIFNKFKNDEILDIYNNNGQNKNYSYSYSSSNVLINQNGKILKGEQKNFRDSKGHINESHSRTINNKTIKESYDGNKTDKIFKGIDSTDEKLFDSEWNSFNTNKSRNEIYRNELYNILD